ncbi:MAG: dipeptide/oligopeptide/nickel ABC transporter ATP-binding protein [Treponemataceae bacterium]|nr:MAG: dipeptide/oligopeptide/nickel ABC transporter ATP-binding protein [Treponemataceae bacterium]
MLKITGLKKTLGGFSLDIESLVIEKPGIYGLIGPNGSGKTTAAKLITGVIPKDEGVIDFAGLAPRDITMLPQKPYMIAGTVYDNLTYPLKIRNARPDRDVCEEMLKKAGLWEKRAQQAGSLSSGERQKLAFMRALIFEPKFVIADEAFVDLDIDSLDMAESLILERQRRSPVTWLIISHQLPHVKRLCEYVFFMNGGRLEARGSAEDILLRPHNLHVIKYLRHEIL